MPRVVVVLACLLAGCSHRDAAAPRDGRIDAPIGARIDAADDARIDAPTDPRRDAPTDARHDAPADARIDAPADAPTQQQPAGTVSCYIENNPAQTCTLPTACCFSNYSSQHDGMCSTTACLWGTIDCDGPEDCTGNQHCCSHPLYTSDGSLAGYSLACQAAACGTAPGDHELCHTGGTACSNGLTCVNAYGIANDLPRTLDICH